MGQYFLPALKKKGQKNWRTYCAHKFDCGLKLMEHSYVNNPLTIHIKKLLFETPTKLVWAGDYAEPEKGKEDNIYVLGVEQKIVPLDIELPEKYYLVNHTKKQFVDYSKIKADEYGYRIDPMPLLCSEGNGEGGGDYYGKNMKLVGTWARDLISIEGEKPTGYQEVKPDFKECDDWEDEE